MPELDLSEVDRVFDILMPRITEALQIAGEHTAEKASATIHSLLLSAASCLAVDEGLSREAAVALVPEMIAAAYEAMTKMLDAVHRDN
jgi:hypothetical protein